MPLSDFPSLHLLTFSLPQHISWGHLPKEPLNTESPLGKTQTKTSPAMHVHVCIVFLHWPESFFRNWVLFFPHRAQHRAGPWNKGGSSRMAKVVPALGCVVAPCPCPELKIMHDREQSLSCPPGGWELASSWHRSVQEESQHQHGGEGVSPKPLLLFYPLLETVGQSQVATNSPGTCSLESKSTSSCIRRCSQPVGPTEMPVNLA